MIILIISNEEMDDIMEIVKSLEDFSLLIERVNKTIYNEIKVLGTLGASLSENLLTGKGVKAKIPE